MRQVLNEIEERDDVKHRFVNFDLVDGRADKLYLVLCQSLCNRFGGFNTIFFISTWEHLQEIATIAPDVKDTA